jgi:hypothetical protein
MPTVKGDQATEAQLVVIDGALGEALELGAITPVMIGCVMCMTQESSCLSLDYGGDTSLGPFQQRDTWGPADVRLDPASSCRMFLMGGEGGQPGWKQHFGSVENAPANLDAAVQLIQVSADPGAYGQWQEEATATVEWWLKALEARYYLKFAAGGERTAAQRYDFWRVQGKLTAQERAWLRMRQLQCAVYAGRLKTAAKQDPDRANQGWRYQELLDRAHGGQVRPF